MLFLDGSEPPVIDGMTGAERFFLSWAPAWQIKLRDEEALRLLSIGPHSPNEFRCNQIVHVPFEDTLGRLKVVPQNRYNKAAVLFG
jgi:predicted metalloendopeptidase